MSVFPHMHLLGKDIICYAVTPTNDTINIIKINKWDFEWQGDYYFKKFLKIPSGSMIYAKGNYDNTASVSNPNPAMVQSGFNTEDEMFVFVFQFLPYESGDENISIEPSTITNTNNPGIESSTKGKLIQIFDIIGKKSISKKNTPLFYLYENGEVEKRIILD